MDDPTPNVPPSTPAIVVKHSLDVSLKNTKFIASSPAGWPVRSGAKGGISFDFPIASTPPVGMDNWLNYLAVCIPKNVKRPLTGTRLRFEMQVISKNPATTFNFVSQGVNTGGTNPPGCTPMIKTGDPWNDNTGMRWWAKERWAIADSEQVILDVSLDPTNWYGVEGQDPLTWKGGDDFKQAILQPTFICLTFGGGFYAGHGVNCSGGPATFNLFTAYSY